MTSLVLSGRDMTRHVEGGERVSKDPGVAYRFLRHLRPAHVGEGVGGLCYCDGLRGFTVANDRVPPPTSGRAEGDSEPCLVSCSPVAVAAA